MRLYYVIGSFTLGILFRSFIHVPGIVALVCIAAACTFLFFRKRKWCLLAFMLLFSFGLGILRFGIADSDPAKNIYDELVGREVIIDAVVSLEPDTRENSINLVVMARSHILVRTSLYSDVRYGDKVRLEGVIKKPENVASGDGKEFDYVAYLAKDEIFYEMQQPKITILAHHQGNPIKEALYSLKESFLTHIEKVIPAPHSALMGGLLLGTKQSLGKALQDDFRRAGIIHIVVLSGYNITIIADWIRKLFSFLPRNYGVGVSIVSVILFAIMTGGEATVVRASIMTLLVIGAQMTRRNYDVTRSLAIAAFLMLFHNPKILVFDSSFQLSFMSTLGLIYVAPIVEKKLLWVTEKWKLREILTTTIATQLFVLPMLLYKMGELSLVGIPVNLLVLGFIPATMLLGFCTGLLAFISVSAAWITGACAYLLLWYEIAVVEFFAHLPFATLKVSYFPMWVAVGVYVVYGFIYLRFYNSPRLPPN